MFTSKKGNLYHFKYNIYRRVTRKDIMEKIKYYIEKYKLILILVSILILLLIFLFIKFIKKEEKVEIISSVPVIEETSKEEAKEELKKIKVDIKGMVKNPGVYELVDNSRVIDVINVAGGLKEGANTEYINLSKKIIDEMVIIIYSNEEVEKYKEVDKEIIYIEYECECPDNINDSCITKDDTVNTNGIKEDNKTEENANVENNNLISINTGTLEELMTLTGIGESKAQAIIEYREKNDGFKTLDEIMNVSGIGEKAYSKIKDNIKL